MEYLLIVYLLINGAWVRGDTMDGWGSITYPSQEICLERKARAEQMQIALVQGNPSVYDKKFVCLPHEESGDG